MVDLNVLPAFIAAVALVTVAPGPDNTYVAAVALSRGIRAGVLSAFGMSLGMVVHVVAAALGLAVLLQSSPWALTLVQLCGGAYLVGLAWATLRTAGRAGAAAAPSADRQVLRRAVLTNLTNPKVILFFAAFLPQFTRPGHGPVAAQLLTLGVIFLGVGLISDGVIALLAGRLGATLASSGRASRILTIAAGLVYAALGVTLLAEVGVRAT
jgi:threonine/homoserine/homoserine lactone efflux protein